MASRYDALTEYLREQGDLRIELPFYELDLIVGGLPPSAKRHQAWWSNSYSSQPHSRCWLDAHRRASPDFVRGLVVFEIGSSSLGRPRSSRLSVDPVQTRPLVPTGVTESIQVRFEYLDAEPIGLGLDGRLACPQLPAQPGVYRIELHSVEHVTTYVGETNNLSRRMTNYRSPGPTQPANIRINGRLVDVLRGGGSVAVSVVLDATANDSPLDLGHRPARLLVENAILVALHGRGDVVENL